MGGGSPQQSDLLSSLEILAKLEKCDIKGRKCRSRILMKRRACLDRPVIRPTNGGVERKVRTLKKLVPNCESMGVERLFRETADYILALQMRVKVMQTMVDVLSAGSDQDDI